jgi:hypothetical protein
LLTITFLQLKMLGKWTKVGLGLVAGAAVGIAGPIIVVGGLGVAGFTTAGVAVGSFAAAAQPAAVAAGSLFAGKLCILTRFYIKT